MDWAIVTWMILIGMVGLLWVMAMAVIHDDGHGSREVPVEKPESDRSVDNVEAHRHNAA